MSKVWQKSKAGPIFGTCCLSTSPEFFTATQSAGLDFVFIDTEHVAIPRDKLSWMCRAYGAAGMPAIVRVPEPEPFRVCEYIDGGAQGIVAPYVETVDQVLTLVGAVKLRPLKGGVLRRCLAELKLALPASTRQCEGAADMSSPSMLYDVLTTSLGTQLCEYLRKKNEDLRLFVNIESTPALQALHDMLAVPGLDGVFIGPADLSVSMGVPRQWHDEGFQAAISDIIKQTSSRGLSVGCHYSFDNAVEYQKKWMSEGANLVIHASDVKLYTNALMQDMALLRSGSESGTVDKDSWKISDSRQMEEDKLTVDV